MTTATYGRGVLLFYPLLTTFFSSGPPVFCGHRLSFALLFNILDVDTKKGWLVSYAAQPKKKTLNVRLVQVRYRVIRATGGNPAVKTGGFPRFRRSLMCATVEVALFDSKIFYRLE